MSRFLFVVPPLVGHTNPTVSVASALVARGHEVAWVGHPSVVRPLLPGGATLLEIPEEPWQAHQAETSEQSRKLKGLASVLYLFKDFLLPLAQGSYDAVAAHVGAYDPDLLIVDQQALAGVAVARKQERRWVTMATTTASLFPSWDGFVEGVLAEFQQAMDVAPPVARPDLSPHGVLALSTRELVGEVELYDVPYCFAGPCFNQRPEHGDFPWESLCTDKPKVLVSLGTISIDRGPRYFMTVMEAFASQPVQVVMVAPAELAADAPDNFIVQPRVPQVALLPHVAAVVCHGGHNTVCEALANAVPLVLTPIRDDQPVVARQVAECGAGLVLRFKRLRPRDLREAVCRVLLEDSFRLAATRIRASFERAGGAAAAAQWLCDVASSG